MTIAEGTTLDTPLDIELTPEQIAADAADEAEFEAAYNSATGESSGTVATTSTSTTAAPAESATGEGDLENDPATGAPLVTPAPTGTAPAGDQGDDDAPVTLTRRQLAELTSTRDLVAALQNELRSSAEKTNGQLGVMNQRFQKEIADVAARAAQGIRPSFDDMAELEEDFPEMAAVLKRNLERMYGVGNATQPGTEGDKGTQGGEGGEGGEASGAEAPGATTASTSAMDDPEVREALKQAQLAIVDATHEGWRSYLATPQWQAWRDQLPAKAQELLRTAKDAETLNDAVADFKEYQQRQAAAASANSQRDKRLEDAIPATTGSKAPVATTETDDEAFEAGFKQARR